MRVNVISRFGFNFVKEKIALMMTLYSKSHLMEENLKVVTVK